MTGKNHTNIIKPISDKHCAFLSFKSYRNHRSIYDMKVKMKLRGQEGQMEKGRGKAVANGMRENSSTYIICLYDNV